MIRKLFNRYYLPTRLKLAYHVLLIPSVLCAFYACKKSKADANLSLMEVTQNPQPNQAFFWLIDSTTTNFAINHYYPPIVNTQTIDLNNDTKEDIKINLIYVVSTTTGYRHIECKIQTASDSSFVLCDSVYKMVRVNHCDSTTETITKTDLFVKALNYGDTLKTKGTWRKGNFHFVLFDQQLQPPLRNCDMTLQSINWQGIICYVGIKVKGRVGWIKFYVDYFKRLSAYEYALAN
jgi:hypothetical protein